MGCTTSAKDRLNTHVYVYEQCVEEPRAPLVPHRYGGHGGVAAKGLGVPLHGMTE